MLVNAEKIVAATQSIIDGVAPVPHHWRQLGGRSAAPAPLVAASAVRTTVVTPSQTALAEGEPITMPFGDLTISEGRIANWLKAVGDRVERGDIVAEIETDKAIVEIEAPIAGILGSIERQKGEVVPMGGRIGSIRS